VAELLFLWITLPLIGQIIPIASLSIRNHPNLTLYYMYRHHATYRKYDKTYSAAFPASIQLNVIKTMIFNRQRKDHETYVCRLGLGCFSGHCFYIFVGGSYAGP
jgi:hypothetical protein